MDVCSVTRRLFDSPTIDPTFAANVNSDAHRAVARQAATEVPRADVSVAEITAMYLS